MLCQLDHANVTVTSIDRAVEFLQTAFPDSRVRGSGSKDHGDWSERWLHLGTDEVYVCLNESTRVQRLERDMREHTGINHVGFIVADVLELHQRYQTKGRKCALLDESPARKRLYVDDADGLTWEFIEYLSDDPAVRNSYEV